MKSLHKVITRNASLYLLLFAMNCMFSTHAQTPWWDSKIPIHLSDVSTADAQTYHVKVTMRYNDPNFGIWFAKYANPSNCDDYDLIGVKAIGYYETFGTSGVPICEIDNSNPPILVHHLWDWQNYSGGTMVWAGDWTWFEDTNYVQPYTRTHPLYGGSAMTYPSGTVAKGFINNQTNDLRKCRIYDAGSAKDIFGKISFSISTVTNPSLLNIPDTGYIGFFSIAKDAACPYWIDYGAASTKFFAAERNMSGIWTDNYGSYDSFGGNTLQNGFGEWSVAKFRDYLTDHFSEDSLKIMGVIGSSGTIADVANFNVRQYLQTKALTLGWDGVNISHAAWTNNAWLSDQVWKAYVIYRRQTGTQALENYYNAIKSSTASVGNSEFLIMGNDYPRLGDGWLRGSVDMVSTEMNLGWDPSCGSRGWGMPADGDRAPFYKTAHELAKGRFVNVWVYNNQYENEVKNTPVALSFYYEMLANHTTPHYSLPNSSLYVGNTAANISFFDFVSNVADSNFGMREPMEDVGILYSTSTYNANSKPGDNWPFIQNETWGWGVALSQLHYQIRMVPEWKLTPKILSGLKVFVMGRAEVVDPAWTAILTDWVNNGGILIVTGESGKTLPENYNFRSASTLTLSSLTGVSSFGSAPDTLSSTHGTGVVFYIKDYIGNDYFEASQTQRQSLLTSFNNIMKGLLNKVGTKTMILNTNIPTTADITLYEDPAAEKLFIDVNNRNVTIATDGLSASVTDVPTFNLTIAKPQWWGTWPMGETKIISPDAITGSLVANVVNDSIVLQIPSCKYYASIILSTDNTTSINNTLRDDITQCKLIPNPNRGEFELYFSSKNENDVVIEISSILGDIVYSEKVQNFTGTYNKRISLPDCHSGIYLVQIKNDHQLISRKLIIN